MTAEEVWNAIPSFEPYLEAGDYEVFQDGDRIFQIHTKIDKKKSIKRVPFDRYIRLAKNIINNSFGIYY